MTVYGYARVSTTGQALDGNSLDGQIAMLKDRGAKIIYKEAYTGMKKDRPQFSKLLNTIKKGDTLMVCKLDRVSRSASDGIKLVDELLERGVVVDILNMGRMDNTPTGKLIRSVMFAFAEFERDMIVERTSAGKEIARQRDGYREGRPEAEYDSDMYNVLRSKVNKGELTVMQACKELGVSRSKWYRICNGV